MSSLKSLLSSGCLALLAAFDISAQAADEFANVVTPFVAHNCAPCHNDRTKTAGLSLTADQDTAAMLRNRAVWEKAMRRARAGEMPPRPMPRPKPEDIQAVSTWVEHQFAEADRTTQIDPGHVTARRLNRAEYNNTIRDLLAVDFKPAAEFPADDSGYGFDNIGDVLTVSPVLMEKYLNAATKIAFRAIPSDVLPRPTRMRYSPEHAPNDDGSELENSFEFPAEGDYVLRVTVSGNRSAAHARFLLDGELLDEHDILIEREKPRSIEVRRHLTAGKHLLAASFVSREPSPEEAALAISLAAKEKAEVERKLAQHPERAAAIRREHAIADPPMYLDTFEVRGPYEGKRPPVPSAYARVFRCGHAPGQHTEACIRPSLADLSRRAYRRPPTEDEVDKLTRLVERSRQEGASWDDAMRLGVEAVLVSPKFLYLIESAPRTQVAASMTGRPASIHPLTDFELASRLSYFLWSSMPDEQLYKLAATGKLHEKAILDSEGHRMLADPKAEALVDNFAGQWLELRNLDSVRPDPEQFPEFNAQLRQAMRTETRMFVDNLIKTDGSILDLLDGRYTFLNERLAKYYGIEGVKGPEFRRVSLDGTQRSGILTQGSVLTVTSYPTRTSPVLRGKWILENVLNAPPPPPPPGVGSIDAKGGPLAGTMRQQMEKHRADPMCAGCHTRMDPLGFALENYDATGRWRTTDAGQPVDASGTMPNGKAFRGSAELKNILMSNRENFAECLTEKLLTYGLGRGLEGYDQRTVHSIAAGVARHEYKFSALIGGIVESAPFQMSHEAPGPTVLTQRNTEERGTK